MRKIDKKLIESTFNIVDLVHNPTSYDILSPIDLDLDKIKLEEVSDLCIKDLGSKDSYQLPDSLQVISDIIKKIHDFEKNLVDHMEDWYCYVTINQGIVKKGTTQRFPGWHIDGMPGMGYKDNCPLKISHCYFIQTALPTLILSKGTFPEFLSTLDTNKYSLFEIFGKYIMNNSIEFQVSTFPLNTLVRTCAYTFHKSNRANEDIFRTFFGVEYTQYKSDSVGNTINPKISSKWKFVSRPMINPNLVGTRELDLIETVFNYFDKNRVLNTPEVTIEDQLLNLFSKTGIVVNSITKGSDTEIMESIGNCKISVILILGIQYGKKVDIINILLKNYIDRSPSKHYTIQDLIKDLFKAMQDSSTNNVINYYNSLDGLTTSKGFNPIKCLESAFAVEGGKSIA